MAYCTTRFPALWRSSLLAGCALLAAMTAASEYWGARASAAPELSAKVLYLLRASAVNPLEPFWRSAWSIQIHNAPGAVLPPLLLLAELRAVVASAPNDPRANFALAVALNGAGRPGQAAELIPKLRSLAAPGPSLAITLETLLRSKGATP